ncbi:MAG: ribbon-helix-helix protein, CopG family [Planctomycetota bacterium]
MTTIEISEELLKRVQARAERTGESVEDLIRRAIDSMADPPSGEAVSDDEMPEWKRSMLSAFGGWSHRDDLDEYLAESRRQSARRQRDLWAWREGEAE